MTSAAVDEHRGLGENELFERYVGTSTPVILRGAIDHWPARRKWTRTFLCERYGDAEIELSSTETGERAVGRLRDYFALPERERARWYLCDWNVRQQCAELLDDIVTPGGFEIDWMGQVPREERPDMLWIYIGHAGTRGPLHVDNYGTSAWLGVLRGEKLVRFVEPGDTPADELQAADVFAARRRGRAFPARDAHLRAGDLLFVPAGCWHAAMNPTYCLSVTANFLDGANLAANRSFWLQRWHGRSILAREIDRLARTRNAAARARLTRHLSRAVDGWRAELAAEQETLEELAARLRSHGS